MLSYSNHLFTDITLPALGRCITYDPSIHCKSRYVEDAKPLQMSPFFLRTDLLQDQSTAEERGSEDDSAADKRSEAELRGAEAGSSALGTASRRTAS
jgi:hypothetical protein